MAVAALVVVLLALLGSTPTDARSTESPSKRWPQFYADDWDDVDAVYSSDVKVKWMAPFFRCEDCIASVFVCRLHANQQAICRCGSGTGLGNEASLMALGVDKYLANKLVIDQVCCCVHMNERGWDGFPRVSHVVFSCMDGITVRSARRQDKLSVREWHLEVSPQAACEDASTVSTRCSQHIVHLSIRPGCLEPQAIAVAS